MPASPAVPLVTIAALAIAVLVAAGPAPGGRPAPVADPHTVRIEVGTEARSELRQPRAVRTDGRGVASRPLAHAPAGRVPRAAPLGQALDEALRTGGHLVPRRRTPISASADGYAPPVDPAVVLGVFDPPSHPWSAGHRGVDLAASRGGPVLAPADGVVVFAGTVVDRGVITVLHQDGLRSSLEPVEAQVDVGTEVGAGQVVGTVQGRSHCGSAPCLHWGVRRGATYLDPLDLLAGSGPTVLLPVP